MAKQTFTTGQVLTAAQLTSLQQTAMSGGAASAKTANYTLVAADAGTAISMTSTSATTITVNTGLFAAGDTVFIQNLGTGNLTITAGTATVNTAGSLILPQYDAGLLYFVSASSAVFYDYIQVGATSPLTTKGDLYTFGTSDTRLAVGANGTTLVADSAETTGLKWATPAAAGFVGVSCTGTGTQTLSTATWTAITWDTEEYDTDGFHSTSSNTSRITVPAGKAGKYLFTSHINLDTNSGTGRRLNKFYKNGVAADISFVEIPPVSGAYVAALNSIILDLAVNDYVEIYYYQTTGVNQVVDRPSSSFQAQYLGA